MPWNAPARVAVWVPDNDVPIVGESLNDALPKNVMVNAVTNLAVLVFTVVIVVAMAKRMANEDAL